MGTQRMQSEVSRKVDWDKIEFGNIEKTENFEALRSYFDMNFEVSKALQTLAETLQAIFQGREERVAEGIGIKMG